MIKTKHNFTGNIPDISTSKISRQKLKNEYGKFNLFISTSHYEDHTHLDIQNFLYVTAYASKDEGEYVSNKIFDLYKKIQYPMTKYGPLFKNKVSAIAYPDFDGSRYPSVLSPPYLPSHFHMIVAARTPEEKNAVINILKKEGNNLGGLHVQNCTEKQSSLYTLMDYSLKAYSKTGFGENPNYDPILLPLANLNSKKNKQGRLAAIAEKRMTRHRYIPDKFILGPGV